MGNKPKNLEYIHFLHPGSQIACILANIIHQHQPSSEPHIFDLDELESCERGRQWKKSRIGRNEDDRRADFDELLNKGSVSITLCLLPAFLCRQGEPQLL